MKRIIISLIFVVVIMSLIFICLCKVLILSKDEAIKIACNDGNVERSDSSFRLHKIKLDNNEKYEIEFVYKDIQYEYDINAYTGDVLDSMSQKIVKGEANEILTVGQSNTKNKKINFKLENIIDIDTAKKIAIANFSFTKANVQDIRVDFDNDDIISNYEVEFYVNKNKYSCDINMITGEVLKSSIKNFYK